MTITLNGKKEIITENTSISIFLKSKEIVIEQVVVEHNSVITKKKELDNIILTNNDKLEVLKFMGGG